MGGARDAGTDGQSDNWELHPDGFSFEVSFAAEELRDVNVYEID